MVQIEIESGSAFIIIKSSFCPRGRGTDRERETERRKPRPSVFWPLIGWALSHVISLWSADRALLSDARAVRVPDRLKMTRERGAASKAKLTHPGKAILAGQSHITLAHNLKNNEVKIHNRTFITLLRGFPFISELRMTVELTKEAPDMKKKNFNSCFCDY